MPVASCMLALSRGSHQGILLSTCWSRCCWWRSWQQYICAHVACDIPYTSTTIVMHKTYIRPWRILIKNSIQRYVLTCSKSSMFSSSTVLVTSSDCCWLHLGPAQIRRYHLWSSPLRTLWNCPDKKGFPVSNRSAPLGIWSSHLSLSTSWTTDDNWCGLAG